MSEYDMLWELLQAVRRELRLIPGEDIVAGARRVRAEADSATPPHPIRLTLPLPSRLLVKIILDSLPPP